MQKNVGAGRGCYCFTAFPIGELTLIRGKFKDGCLPVQYPNHAPFPLGIGLLPKKEISSTGNKTGQLPNGFRFEKQNNCQSANATLNPLDHVFLCGLLAIPKDISFHHFSNTGRCTDLQIDNAIIKMYHTKQ